MKRALLLTALASACTGPSGLVATPAVTAPPTTASMSTTSTLPAVAPRQNRTAAKPPPMGRVVPNAHLAAIRECESGGSGGYTADTGNGFYGAYQFDQGTWESVGGSRNPAHASPAEQDARAQALYDKRGAKPWPGCGRRG